MILTNRAFQALAALLRLRASRSREAARLVLVDGMRQADAARESGISAQNCHDAVASCKRGLKLVDIICEERGKK
ncbi:MAG: transcriptional regulator KorA [Candidatus Accumulibacter sp.]|jgi:predicted DNA-binding protein (UPF0251 family)|nr:transcriptional regulator KorA [Accumulibacter sp.]